MARPGQNLPPQPPAAIQVATDHRLVHDNADQAGAFAEAGGRYRLSKFQDALPEAMALEMIGRYLLDIDGTLAFLQEPT